jgi:DNA-binding NtrC family response regulator
MSEQIIFVDDEPAVLEGYERLLRQDFQIETAPSAAEALTKLSTSGPYAVIVADMRMPEMDGAQLLSKVMVKFPEVIRIMLTGSLDIQTAVRAVNEGNIFRFITKPCEKEALLGTLNAALIQYRLSGLKNQYYKAAVESGPPVLEKAARNLALEEAAEQVRALLTKDAKTRLPSIYGGVYLGKTIWIGPEHVVQRISLAFAVAHPKQLLNATPNVGDVVRIEYDNGTGVVEEVSPSGREGH